MWSVQCDLDALIIKHGHLTWFCYPFLFSMKRALLLINTLKVYHSPHPRNSTRLSRTRAMRWCFYDNATIRLYIRHYKNTTVNMRMPPALYVQEINNTYNNWSAHEHPARRRVTLTSFSCQIWALCTSYWLAAVTNAGRSAV